MRDFRIAIVEEEVKLAELIADLLRESGYQVLQPAHNYYSALHMLQHDKPDLLLLNHLVSNPETGQGIDQYLHSSLNIPLVLLISGSDTRSLQRARKALANSYLVKPFQKSDLFSCIEIALDNFGILNKRAMTLEAVA